jgi:hypothetical protein
MPSVHVCLLILLFFISTGTFFSKKQCSNAPACQAVQSNLICQFALIALRITPVTLGIAIALQHFI